AHRSGARTASVFGNTSQPTRIKRAAPSKDHQGGHIPLKAGHQAKVTSAPLATVLPRTIVASNSEGCFSNWFTSAPPGRSDICPARQLPSAKRADSARAKKKLALANTSTPLKT